MKIRLLTIKGEGFLSFLEPFELHLSPYEGHTVQINGENQDDPLSTSNGSGKSSLLEAISWGLYGKLNRNNRYNDEVIYNRNGVVAPKARVELELLIGEDHYIVARELKWKKSMELRLWKNSEELLTNATYSTRQQYLEQTIIGMNFTAFQCSEMFGRDFMSFPDLSPSERARILEEIRGLEAYSIASQRSQDYIKSLQNQLQTLQESIAHIEGQITELKRLNYQAKIKEFEDNRQRQIQLLQSTISDLQITLQEKRKNLKQMINYLQDELQAKNHQSDVINTEIQQLTTYQDKQLDLTKQVTKLQTQITYFNQELRKLNSDYVSMKSLKQGKCPTCHQTITDQHLQIELKRIESEIDKLNSKIRQTTNQLTNLKSNLEGINDKIDELNSLTTTHSSLQMEISEIATKLELLKSGEDGTLKNLEFEINQTKQQLQKVASEVNPYTEYENQRKIHLIDLTKSLKQYQEEYDSTQQEMKYYEFWKEGFKSLRLQLFRQTIDKLQQYAQAFLNQYSSELQVQLTTERETRSGTTKEELNIIITDSSGVPLSYEMYSGGEKQKIRLSVAMALAQTIKEDWGEFNFIAFDEPNDALDDIGKEVNFELFSQLAQEGKLILVTDHDSIFKDKFDLSIRVIKQNGKSCVKYD